MHVGVSLLIEFGPRWQADPVTPRDAQFTGLLLAISKIAHRHGVDLAVFHFLAVQIR